MKITQNHLIAAISLVLLVVGAVWLNNEESIIAGAMLIAGFIGCVASLVYFRNKKELDSRNDQ